MVGKRHKQVIKDYGSNLESILPNFFSLETENFSVFR